jgi:benzoyl-CoA reductase subunit D
VITAGIDIGSEAIKAVILNDGKIGSFAVVRAGFELGKAADEALDLALSKTKLSRTDVSRIVATGSGRKEVSITNDNVSEIVADAHGAFFLSPTVRTIIDIGNEQALGIRCDSAGKIVTYGKNEKCAAGVGAFVETMARALEVPIEQLGVLSQKATQDISLNFTCAVFAETEVVSLIHAKTPKPDIARAIHDAIAMRITGMIGRVGVEKEVMLVGGVVKNIGVVERLERHLGMKTIVPEEPQIVAALGAALIARD